MNLPAKSASGSLWLSLGALAIGGLVGLFGQRALESHSRKTTAQEGE